MRDALYYYLLLICNEPILIEWYAGRASVLKSDAASKYPIKAIQGFVNEAAIVCTEEGQPFSFASKT